MNVHLLHKDVHGHVRCAPAGVYVVGKLVKPSCTPSSSPCNDGDSIDASASMDSPTLCGEPASMSNAFNFRFDTFPTPFSAFTRTRDTTCGDNNDDGDCNG